MLLTTDHIGFFCHGTTPTTIFGGRLNGIRQNNQLSEWTCGPSVFEKNGQDAIFVTRNNDVLMEIPFADIEWDNCGIAHQDLWGTIINLDARDILDHPLHDFIMEEYNFVCPIGEDGELDENGIVKNRMVFIDTYRTAYICYPHDPEQSPQRYARVTHKMRDMLLEYYHTHEKYSHKAYTYKDVLALKTTVDHEHFRIRHK